MLMLKMASSGGGSLGGSDDGLIFVWDLDQTLISGPLQPQGRGGSPDININTNALKLMNAAFESGKLTANLMLTNNSDNRFITAVQIALLKKYNELYDTTQIGLFNATYSATHMNRVVDETVPKNLRTPGHKAKRLEDVKNMLNDINLPTDSLESRVFFFDDLPHHMIRKEIGDHYIQITPPFNTDERDTTNYGPVYAALGRQEGGASRKKARILKRNTRKAKGKGKKHTKKLTKWARLK